MAKTKSKSTRDSKLATPSPPTKAATADPLKQVQRWVLDGHSEADITEAIAAEWPDADARPLILKCLAATTAAGKPDAVLVRGFALEATREIYRKSLEVADHMTALRALRQMVELAERGT